MQYINFIEIFFRGIFAKGFQRDGKEGQIVVVRGKKMGTTPLLWSFVATVPAFPATEAPVWVRAGVKIAVSDSPQPLLFKSNISSSGNPEAMRMDSFILITPFYSPFRFRTAVIRRTSAVPLRQSGQVSLRLLLFILSPFTENFNLLRFVTPLLGENAILPTLTLILPVFFRFSGGTRRPRKRIFPFPPSPRPLGLGCFCGISTSERSP